MSGINFLDNKQPGDDQKPKDKDVKEKLAWSNPKKETKEIKGSKSSAFSFLPFMNKKEPADTDKEPVPAIDKNKIKESREEILNLIKHHEDSKPLPEAKGKNFLSAIGEKLKRQPGHHEVLIDYQRVFNQEKEHKNKIGKIFSIKTAVGTKPPPLSVKAKDSWFKKLAELFKSKGIAPNFRKSEAPKTAKLPPLVEIKPAAVPPVIKPKPAVELKPAPPAAVRAKNDWLKGLAGAFKSKGVDLSAHKQEPRKEVKLPPAEAFKPAAVKPPPVQPIIRPAEKPAEVKEIPEEIKAEEKKPLQQNEIRQRVIETNLIQGELVTFFDWRSKAVVLVSAILLPIFVIGGVYYGLVFYQKSNQAKNSAQAKKFAELEQNIAKEEAGIKEIPGFEAQLKIVSQIFSQHIYWTNFFNFLEDNTIKGVHFVNFDGDTSGSYKLDALAVNYSGLAEQINVLKNNKRITAVEAEGGELVAGDNTSQSLVKFILNFTVAKNIFTE